MRILLLTLLIVGPYFYFREDKVAYDEVAPMKDKEDAVKLKLMAPARYAKVEPSAPASAPVERSVEEADEVQDDFETERAPAVDTEVEEVQWTDLEEAWNHELKSMLSRLEPEEGEEIHKSYQLEKESYQAEMDALINEKNQKTTDEAVAEIDGLIAQLDEKHQDKLREILGAHYEAVRDHYDQFMEASSSQY